MPSGVLNLSKYISEVVAEMENRHAKCNRHGIQVQISSRNDNFIIYDKLSSRIIDKFCSGIQKCQTSDKAEFA